MARDPNTNPDYFCQRETGGLSGELLRGNSDFPEWNDGDVVLWVTEARAREREFVASAPFKASINIFSELF